MAILLVEVNRVVSVDQLMERVWNDSPPQRGRAVLYTYLSRLRTVLSTDPEVAIQRRSGGYVLAVSAEAVDMHRFRRMVADARATADDIRALALFDQALSLWRGTPFADLDIPWLASVRGELEVERRAAQLDRTDAALRCGQHTALVAELSTRATEQPLDERIAGQLMLALAGSGRRADALSTYQRARHGLVDQLGLEPGPELRRLHHSILAGDTPLATPTPTAPAWSGGRSGVVVPRQLPAASRHFTGRQAELETLSDLLAPTEGDGGPVVITAIDGMPGIGKTALAVHAAHRLADRFPDGILFTDLRGFAAHAEPTPPEQVLDQLLHGLGVPGSRIPPGLDARAGLYRSVLAGRRVLVVLDNAVDETQVTPLLPATGGCAVILTSRRHLAGLDDAAHLTLPVLDPTEAAILFRGSAGDRATPADRPDIERVVARCGYLPLAIRITAARLRRAPAATTGTVRAELDHALDAGRGLDWLSDGHRAIGAALALSYRHLAHDQQHGLRLAGLHPGPDLEPYAFAALADVTLDQAAHVLDELSAASLLDQSGPRRYRMHDLVAAYAGRLAADLPETGRREAMDRLFDHYASVSSLAVDVIHPWEADRRPRPPGTHNPTPGLSGQHEAQAWLDIETHNLLAAAHRAATQSRADHTLHQSATLRQHLHGRSRYGEAIRLHQRALAIARRAGEHGAEQAALIGLGRIHYRQGRFRWAANCYQRALESARATGDRPTQHDALIGLGRTHYVQGRYGPAADFFQYARESARQAGNRPAELQALRGLGHVHHREGRHDAATECFERGLALARQAGDQQAEQHLLVGLGDVHRTAGRYDTATDLFRQALGIAHCVDDRNGQFEALQALGRVSHDTEHHRDALYHHHRALELAIALEQPCDQARAHDGLAHAHHALRDPGPARHHWHTALELLAGVGTDHTDDPDVAAVTIQARLSALQPR